MKIGDLVRKKEQYASSFEDPNYTYKIVSFDHDYVTLENSIKMKAILVNGIRDVPDVGRYFLTIGQFEEEWEFI